MRKLEINYSYAEVLEVLGYMEDKYVKKIPKLLIEFFRENSSQDYKKHINPYIKLKNQNLQRKTLAILAMLNNKYWINNINKVNLKAREEIKYTDDIFENSRKTKEDEAQNVYLVEKRKDSFFEKIIKWFKNFKK